MISKPLLDLTPSAAIPYLQARGFRDVRVSELPGGVSNTVLLVEHKDGRFVLKQALPQLRVEQEWLCDLRRIYVECLAIRIASDLLPPESVPEVLFEDQPNFAFAMTAAPEGSVTWKSHLLAGNANPSTGEQVARTLALLIRHSWQSPELGQAFADTSIFEDLRLAPYYTTTGSRHPDLKERLDQIAANCRARRYSLVHGDYSPKNILVSGARSIVIDFEVMHFGDPSFDAAFLLNHLLLKTFYGIAGAPAVARAFWRVLTEEMPAADWFEAAVLEHLGGLLLARMDGKSPVEYIRDEALKTRIRQFARKLILSRPDSVLEVWKRYDNQH